MDPALVAPIKRRRRRRRRRREDKSLYKLLQTRAVRRISQCNDVVAADPFPCCLRHQSYTKKTTSRPALGTSSSRSLGRHDSDTKDGGAFTQQPVPSPPVSPVIPPSANARPAQTPCCRMEGSRFEHPCLVLGLGFINGLTLRWERCSAPPRSFNHASADKNAAFTIRAVTDLLAAGTARVWPRRPRVICPLGVVQNGTKQRQIWDGCEADDH